MDNLDGDKNNYNILFPHQVEGLKHIYGNGNKLETEIQKWKRKPMNTRKTTHLQNRFTCHVQFVPFRMARGAE